MPAAPAASPACPASRRATSPKPAARPAAPWSSPARARGRAGGGAGGLDAATGVMNWLEEQGKGLDVGVGRLPLVPAAVLFDLQVGDMRIRPGAAAGHAACADASSEDLPQGNVGAGAGATIGKVFGMQYAMKGGIG